MASVFPPPQTADNTGLVCTTPSLDANMLLDAYTHGIFPWSEHPVRWYSPDPRAVFLPERIHLSRSMRKTLRRNLFRVTFDTCFHEVITQCAKQHEHEGAWITEGFIDAYAQLHELGFAHSVEVWEKDALVGGLYGAHIGSMFAGESMFHHKTDASKVAFAHLIGRLMDWGTVLIDAQVINAHTASLGAVCILRSDFLWLLSMAIKRPNPVEGSKWPAVR